MNSVALVGRLTKDPEVRYSQGEDAMAVARFTLAVDRKFKGQGQQADFIRCIAFKKTAETIERYCNKGTKIGVEGRIQTGSYKAQDGRTVYTTDVVVDSFEFMTSRAENATQSVSESIEDNTEGFVSVADAQEELPFI